MKEKLRNSCKRGISLLCATMMVVSTFAYMPAIQAKAAGFTVEASETDTLEELIATGAYKEVTPEIFGITEAVTKVTGENQQFTYTSNVWNKKVFHGQVKFSKNSTDRLFFGHAAWNGIYFWGNSAGNISIGYTTSSTTIDCGAITVAEMNGKALTDEYIDLAVSFEIVESGTLRVGIFIDGNLCEGGYLKLTGVNTDIFGAVQAVIDIRSDGSSISIAPLPPKQYVFVEASETDTLDELLATGSYTEINPEAFGITEATTVNGTSQLYAPTGSPIWENKVFHGQVKFSTNESDRIYFGHAAECGLYLHGNAQGNISVGYKVGATIREMGEITVEEMNGKTLTGEFVDLAVSIKVTGDSHTGVGEAVFGIFIDGKLCEGGYLRVTEINTEILRYAVLKFDVRGLGTGISIAPIPPKQYVFVEPSETDTLDELLATGSYTEINPEAFGITEATTVNGTSQLYAPTGSPIWENKVFHGQVKFSTNESDRLYFGHAAECGLYLHGNAQGNIAVGYKVGTAVREMGEITVEEMDGKTLTGEFVDLAVSIKVTGDSHTGVGEAVFGIFIDGQLCEGGYLRVTEINTEILRYAVLKLDARGLGTGISIATLDYREISEKVTIEPSEIDTLEELIATGSYVELTAETFGIDEVMSQSGKSQLLYPTEWPVWAEKVFHAQVRFSTNESDRIYLGHASQYGVYLHGNADGSLSIGYEYQSDIVDCGEITVKEMNGKALTNKFIDLAVSISVTGDSSKGAGEALIGVFIDGQLCEKGYLRVKDINTEILLYSRSALDIRGLGESISMASLNYCEKELTLDKLFATDKYTEVKPEDFRIFNPVTKKKGEDQQYVFANNNWDKKIFHARVQFSSYNTDQLFLGHAAWNGFYLWGNAENGIDYGVNVSGVQKPYGTITVEEMNGKPLTGDLIDIAVSFDVLKVDDSAGVVLVGIFIDGKICEDGYIYISGINTEIFYYATAMLDVRSAGTSITVAPPLVKGLAEISALPTITPIDFGIADQTYTYADGDKVISGQLQENYYPLSNEDTVAGKVFSANVQFGGKGEQIRIGGTDNSVNKEWSGLLFVATATGFHINGTEGNILPEGGIDFELERTGLGAVNDEFNLKLSFEIVNDDVKLGVWFNEQLYDDTWYCLEGFADYLGNYMMVYCPTSEGTVKISSDASTPYILEDFGVYNQTITQSNVGTEYYSGTLITMDKTSSIKGKLSIGENAKVILYGKGEHPEEGCQLYIDNAILKMNFVKAIDEEVVTIATMQLAEINVGEKFEFLIRKEQIDADSDGVQDDIRLSIWINDAKDSGQFITVLDYQSESSTFIAYPNSGDGVIIYDSVDVEVYTLENIQEDGGYLVSGEDCITINGESSSNGTKLTTSGDYIIRNVGVGTYVKYVVIYQVGNVHLDNGLDVKDLVAIKKAALKRYVGNKSIRLKADVDGNGEINDADANTMREYLVGETSLFTIADNSLSFETDVMPIGGYFGPYSIITEQTEYHESQSYNYLTEDIYQKINELGVNLIVKSNNDYSSKDGQEQIKEGLRLAEQYNIDVLISDSSLSGGKDATQLAEYLAMFSRYSSFKGIHLVDEPFTNYYGKDYYQAGIRPLENYSEQSGMLNKYCNVLGYINLNPMGGHLIKNGIWADLMMKYNYEKYIDQYIETCNPKILSWDYYVHDAKIEDMETYANTEGYFYNLKLMRTKSLEHNIPFWSFVQAGSNWNDSAADAGTWETEDDLITKEDLLWNVNTALAYGAKGIQYFPLIQPYYFAYGGTDGKYDNFNRNGLIGADGSKTKWYDHAQEANQWIAWVDEVLMNAVSQEVLVAGTTAQSHTGIKKTSFGSLARITASDGAIVGVFSYQGKTAYYVVNYDTVNSQDVKLEFNGTKNTSILVQGTSKETTSTSDGITLSLKAGNAALVITD